MLIMPLIRTEFALRSVIQMYMSNKQNKFNIFNLPVT